MYWYLFDNVPAWNIPDTFVYEAASGFFHKMFISYSMVHLVIPYPIAYMIVYTRTYNHTYVPGADPNIQSHSPSESSVFPFAHPIAPFPLHLYSFFAKLCYIFEKVSKCNSIKMLLFRKVFPQNQCNIVYNNIERSAKLKKTFWSFSSIVFVSFDSSHFVPCCTVLRYLSFSSTQCLVPNTQPNFSI